MDTAAAAMNPRHVLPAMRIRMKMVARRQLKKLTEAGKALPHCSFKSCTKCALPSASTAAPLQIKINILEKLKDCAATDALDESVRRAARCTPVCQTHSIQEREVACVGCLQPLKREPIGEHGQTTEMCASPAAARPCLHIFLGLYATMPRSRHSA